MTATSSNRGLATIRDQKAMYCPNCYLGKLEYVTVASSASLDKEAGILRAKSLTDPRGVERIGEDEEI